MERTIVCFGDSNTHGYDTSTDGRFDVHTRWTGVLRDLLGEGYLVCEEGIGGRTTVFEDPLTEGMSGLSMIRPVLLTHEPVDLLIIMLGTNDTKQRFGATPENIASGLTRLVRKAADTKEAFRKDRENENLHGAFRPGHEKGTGIKTEIADPEEKSDLSPKEKQSIAQEEKKDIVQEEQPQILIVCPPPILPVYRERVFSGEMGEGCDMKSARLSPLFREVAKQQNCYFLDAASIPGVQMSEQWCGMHMEAPAHKALGEALAEKVREILPV